MFRLATPQNTRRAQPQLGSITPLAIPAKGLNARDSLSLMGPQYAISLVNVLCEPYGLRTRKGYTEWARNLSPGIPVGTMMSYYPADTTPEATALPMRVKPISLRLFTEPRVAAEPPVGSLFAAVSGRIYDVTAGGFGPWSPMPDVSGTSDFWTWINFQNLAGSFLVACNDDGGYAYFDGSSWTTPVLGSAPGEITGVDPAFFCYVVEHKKRLWFVEKESTSAWYLPVSQVTGVATEFNFGEQFRHGGHLVAVVSWTVDGGIGVDDYLVAVSSQGDIALYKGNDPDSSTGDFAIQGVWHLGALPAGRRSVLNT